MPSGPTDYLAAERTFLAWIRTGLALMGFGFVVARFGLFLQEMHISQPQIAPPSYGFSFWFGTVLTVLGVVVNIASTVRYVRMIQDLNNGDLAIFHRPSRLGIGIAVLLAVVGVAMAVYLISFR